MGKYIFKIEPTLIRDLSIKPGFWDGQVKSLQDFLKKQSYFPKEEPTSRHFGALTKSAAANAIKSFFDSMG